MCIRLPPSGGPSDRAAGGRDRLAARISAPGFQAAQALFPAHPELALNPEMSEDSAERFYVITGASGAGKSTLLAALGELGYSTVPEAALAIVREQQECNGSVLPWVNARRSSKRS